MPRAPPSVDRGAAEGTGDPLHHGEGADQNNADLAADQQALFSGVMPRSGSTVDITSNTGNMSR